MPIIKGASLNEMLRLAIPLWLFGIAVFPGCAPLLTVRNEAGRQLQNATRTWQSPPLAESTQRLLRRRRLSTSDDLLPATLVELLDYYRHSKSAETVFAIADVSNRDSQQLDLHDPDFLQTTATALVFSEKYLFDREARTDLSPFDDRFRRAGAIYNQSLQRLIEFAIEHDKMNLGDVISTTVNGSPTELEIAVRGNVRVRGGDRFEFASDYPNKLLSRHQTYGLGVPLLKISPQRGGDEGDTLQKYLDRIPQSVTAMAEISQLHRAGDASPVYTGQILLHNPNDATDVEYAGQTVRLRSDVSAPIVHWKKRNKTAFNRVKGLLDPDAIQQDGLYMLEPFNPNKIPIVLIHGLASNPLTWVDAYNDLRSDPLINDSFQFWFYFYPTGQPFQESAADLRRDLAQLRREVPMEQQTALGETVLIGHSMGGLVARMVSVDSDQLFEDAMFTRPIEAGVMQAAAIEPIYRFDHDPMVSRVITVATPHRGSGYSGRITRALNRWINQIRPFSTTSERAAILQQLEEENPGWLKDPHASVNSVDTLARTSPILAALNEASPQRAIHNNIYGHGQNEILHEKFYKLTGIPIQANWIRISGEDTDGVVGVRSASFAEAESNFPVRASHGEIQSAPQTISELRKQLIKHTEAYGEKLRRGDGTIMLVSGDEE